MGLFKWLINKISPSPPESAPCLGSYQNIVDQENMVTISHSGAAADAWEITGDKIVAVPIGDLSVNDAENLIQGYKSKNVEKLAQEHLVNISQGYGPSGSYGPIGAQGPTGVQGSTGIMGVTGIMGSTGVNGTGPAGNVLSYDVTYKAYQIQPDIPVPKSVPTQVKESMTPTTNMWLSSQPEKPNVGDMFMSDDGEVKVFSNHNGGEWITICANVSLETKKAIIEECIKTKKLAFGQQTVRQIEI